MARTSRAKQERGGGVRLSGCVCVGGVTVFRDLVELIPGEEPLYPTGRRVAVPQHALLVVRVERTVSVDRS